MRSIRQTADEDDGVARVGITQFVGARTPCFGRKRMYDDWKRFV
jgi:hypothetical protein